jgi:hypothetical protein
MKKVSGNGRGETGEEDRSFTGSKATTATERAAQIRTGSPWQREHTK